MKKGIIATAVAMLTSAVVAHAGSMGPVAMEPHAVPYLSGEGSYTWNGLNGVTLNQHASVNSGNGWGGRLAAGVVRPYSEKLGLVAEVGGGYYGDFKSAIAGLNTRSTIDGYDISVGGLYQMDKVGMFGNVGFMAQNLRSSISRNRDVIAPQANFQGSVTSNRSQTQILPELKVGLLYNVYNNLDLSLAYMYVFGSNVQTTGTVSVLPNGFVNTVSNINAQNPSMNSLLFGLRYNFV